ncbi:MAG: AAA family ATPase, partial [Acidimicrobiia bacterium]
MRITRLLLRNYRVFEDELELHLPAGLVGIYGPNGAGKSALIESIRWTLWGQARTGKDEVRTAGVNAECLTEVEFEHEGHLYLVRRTLTGVNHTVRAEAHWNGRQVAEGVRDVATYVHSVLGMDDQSFRASVFAEQKQVAAFSAQSPGKRRDLVLRLLGITPLDRARDGARTDAREARADHDRLAARLPDLDALAAAAEAAGAARAEAEAAAAEAAAALERAGVELGEAEAAFERVDDLGRTYDNLVADGRGAADLVREHTDRIEQLTREHDELEAAAAGRDDLVAAAAGIDALEGRVRLLVALDEARARAEAVAVPAVEPPVPDPAPAEAARAAAERAATAASTLDGTVHGLGAELARARTAAERSDALSPHGECPVCGQALGDAFEQVQAHRAAEVVDAERRLAEARRRLAEARADAGRAAAAAEAALAEVAAATAARQRWEQVVARRAELDDAAALHAAAADPPPVDGERPGLERSLDASRAAAAALARLVGRLERRAKL